MRQGQQQVRGWRILRDDVTTALEPAIGTRRTTGTFTMLEHAAPLTCAYTIAYLSRLDRLHANGFDWDKGNRGKCEKRGLSASAIQSPRPIRSVSAVFAPIAGTENGRGDKKEIEAHEKENANL
jgi:hypothetical protein